MDAVSLTTDQSARIEALSDDCAIVGMKDERPLVRQADGEVAERALRAAAGGHDEWGDIRAQTRALAKQAEERVQERERASGETGRAAPPGARSGGARRLPMVAGHASR